MTIVSNGVKMDRKSYLIGGQKFYLKDYGDLTGFEEEKIEKLLCPTISPHAEDTGTSYSAKEREEVFDIKVSSYEIFPIILVPESPSPALPKGKGENDGLALSSCPGKVGNSGFSNSLPFGKWGNDGLAYSLPFGKGGGWAFDWRHITNRQIAEILTDFIVEKKTSHISIQDYMIKLIRQKLQQSLNMKESTGEADQD